MVWIPPILLSPPSSLRHHPVLQAFAEALSKGDFLIPDGASTVKRAPLWWQMHSLEWLYRLIKEPRRMWRRYIIGAAKFLYYLSKEL